MSLCALHTIFAAFLLVSSEEFIGEITIEVGDPPFVMQSGDIIKSRDLFIRLEHQGDDLVLIHNLQVLWSLSDDGGIPTCYNCVRTIEMTSNGQIRVMDDGILTSALGIAGQSSRYSFHVSGDGYMYLQCDDFVTSFSETLLSDPVVVWIAGVYRARSGRSQSHSFLHSISTTESQDFEFVEGDTIYSLNGRTKLVAMDLNGLAFFNAKNPYDPVWSMALLLYSNPDQQCVMYGAYFCDTSFSSEGTIFMSNPSGVIDAESGERHGDGSYSLTVSNNLFYIENSGGERIFYSDTIGCNTCVFDGAGLESMVCSKCQPLTLSILGYSQRSIHYQQTIDASSCSLNLPGFSQSVTMDTYDTVQSIGNVVIGILSAASVVSPAAGGIAGLLSTGFGFANLMGAGDADNSNRDEQIFETISELFEQAWECTTNYVDQQLEQLQADLFDSFIIGDVRNSIRTADSYLTLLNTYDTPAEQYDQFMSHTGVNVQLDDVADSFNGFTFSEDPATKSRECRKLIPFIHLAMYQRIIAMRLYIDLSHFADDIDWDSQGFTVTDLEYTGSFLISNIMFMELYLDCVGPAYINILRDSDTLKLSHIQHEIDVLFDGEMFCSWIEVSEEWGVSDSLYDWDSDVNTDFDFTVFADCDSATFTHHMIELFETYDLDSLLNSDSWSVEVKFEDGEDTLTPYQTLAHEEQSEAEVRDKADCQRYEWSAYDVQPCDHSATDTNGEIMLYFGQLDKRTVWMKNAGTGCNSECGIGSNPDDIDWSLREKAFSCPNDRRLRGARYIVESYSDMPTIAGLEILCTKDTLNGVQDDWTSKISVGFDDALIDDAVVMQWSPWKICPKNFYLSIRIEGMECKREMMQQSAMYRNQQNEHVWCTDFFRDFLYAERSHVIFEEMKTMFMIRQCWGAVSWL